MSVADWPESRRRLFGLSAALLFVAIAFFIAAANIGEAPDDQRAELWRLFTVTAIGVACLMGWYSWRKLTRPDFDTTVRFDRAKILLPGIALALGITRLLPDDGAGPVVGGGVGAGFFGGVLLVYGFDAITNRLSEGRSWRGGRDDGGHPAHSKTSSPS